MSHTTTETVSTKFRQGVFLGRLYPTYYHLRTDISEEQLYAGMIVGYSRFTTNGDLPKRPAKLLIWSGEDVIEQLVDTATDQRYPDNWIIDPEWFATDAEMPLSNTIIGYIDGPRKFTAEKLLKWNGQRIVEADYHTFKNHKLTLQQLIFPHYYAAPTTQIDSYTLIGVDFGPQAEAPIKYLYLIQGQIYTDSHRFYFCPPFDELFSTDDKTINYGLRIDSKAQQRAASTLPKELCEKLKKRSR